ncbi:MAG TPA: extracellular solute-binding protein [Myxococcota bacterium]
MIEVRRACFDTPELGSGPIPLAGLLVAAALALACGPRPVTVALAVLPGELGAVRAIADEWAHATGHEVRVVAQQYPEIRRALAAEAAGGGGALDLVELDVHSLALSADHVAPLPAARLASVIGVLEPATVGAGDVGGLRFLPYRVSWQALIYDARTLDAPPATWDELLAVARAHSGRIGWKGARYEGLTCDILPFVWAAGGSGERFDEPGARAAFELFAALAPHLHPHASTFKEATVAEAMARGELVLHLNWPFAMRLYASQGLAPDRIRAAPIPAGPAGRATVLGGGYLGIPVNAPNREAALDLLAHLLSQPVQERLARELGWFSARRDVAVAAGSDDLLAAYAASRPFARPRPERRDYPLLSRLWQEAFRSIAFEDAPPDAALAEAARAWRARR